MKKKYYLEIINLSFVGTSLTSLYNINLKVEEGQILGVVGKNTQSLLSLLQICMGIKKQNLGRIIFDGQDASQYKMEDRLKLGIVLLVHSASKIINWQFKKVNLGRYIFGHKKRLNRDWSFLPWQKTMQGERCLRELLKIYEVYRSYSIKPKCLFVFQSFENLNPFTYTRLRESFNMLAAEGCSIVLFTRKTDNLYLLCNKVAFLENGELVSFVAGNSENFADLEEVLKLKDVE